MAHFAKLDNENYVINVHGVHNNVITINGIESEQAGIDFLTNLHGYNLWKQTSYNGNFRKNYAGIGYYYDSIRDAFIPPKPFPSWILNEDSCLWDSPIPYPDITNIPLPYQLYNRYFWNEDVINWVLQKPFDSWQLSDEYYYYISPTPYPTDGNNYYWNEETLNWELINI